MSEAVIFRQAVQSDLGFIYSTYLRDLRDADPGALPDDLWYPAHRAQLDQLLGTCSDVLIAAAADEPSEILGYVIADKTTGVLWWIHVRKGPLRNHGLAKRLLQAASATEMVAAWSTQLGRQSLRNQPRGRRVRQLWMDRQSKDSGSIS